MLSKLKKYLKPTRPCDHGAFSFSIDADKPASVRCHLCDRLKIRYNTEIPLFEGSLHTKHEIFWIDSCPELEAALQTSPREYGDLKIEKFLRRNGYL